MQNINDDKYTASVISQVPRYLMYLDLSHNKLACLRSLEQLTCLLYLNASSNRLTSLEGLQNCRQLRELVVDHNQISDLRWLTGMQSYIHLVSKLSAWIFYCFTWCSYFITTRKSKLVHANCSATTLLHMVHMRAVSCPQFHLPGKNNAPAHEYLSASYRHQTAIALSKLPQ